ncbi:hypothetical protein ABGA94_22205, partial [Stenotrophomonas sp. 3diitr2024]
MITKPFVGVLWVLCAALLATGCGLSASSALASRATLAGCRSLTAFHIEVELALLQAALAIVQLAPHVAVEVALLHACGQHQ